MDSLGQNIKKASLPTKLGTIVFVLMFAVVGTQLLSNSRAASPADRVLTNADSAALANGFTIPAGQVWEFDPNQDVQINTKGSVIVLGTLRMQPKSHDIEHFLRFVEIDESKFTGGCLYPNYPVVGCGTNSMQTDVGLWVTDNGKLETNGSEKTSWTRLAGAANAGDTTIRLENSPVGWQVGDEISVVPTEAPTVRGFSDHFDLRKITAINGSQVTLSSPLTYPHPQIANPGPDGGFFRAEVLNLSRNVRIEGQDATHRSHIAVQHAKLAQAISNVSIRYMGPHHSSTSPNRANQFVLGRYGLHFHMNSRITITDVNDGSRRPQRVVQSEFNWPGAIVDGVVIRDTDSHAFVAHESDNVTFKNTISYRTSEEPYWWDSREFGNPLAEAKGNTANSYKIPVPSISNNITYDHTVAALITPRITNNTRNYRAAGYYLAEGENLTVNDSVAVGTSLGTQSSGFKWPEDAHSVWKFNKGNISHNNAGNGIFGWQNDNLAHDIENTVLYHNGEAGVFHGAYQNIYKYANLTILGNGRSGFEFHAAALRSRPISFSDSIIDGLGGITDYGITFEKHALPAAAASKITNVKINGVVNKVAVRATNDTDSLEWYDFVGVNVTPSDFRVFTPNPLGVNIRVQPTTGTSYQFTSNALTPTTIAAFATNPTTQPGAKGPWTVPNPSPQILGALATTPPTDTTGGGTTTPPAGGSGSGSGDTTDAAVDVNGDGLVNVFDLSFVLANWNSRSVTAADINKDGVVNILDLSLLLSRWNR